MELHLSLRLRLRGLVLYPIVPDVREVIANLLSLQELELSGSIPKKKIEDAQHEIVAIVRKLEKEF